MLIYCYNDGFVITFLNGRKMIKSFFRLLILSSFVLSTAVTAQQNGSVPKIMLVCSGKVTASDDPNLPGDFGRRREGVYLELLNKEARLYNIGMFVPDGLRLKINIFNIGSVHFQGPKYFEGITGNINRISGEISVTNTIGTRSDYFNGSCNKISKRIF
jgi:hypothetical protein